MNQEPYSECVRIMHSLHIEKLLFIKEFDKLKNEEFPYNLADDDSIELFKKLSSFEESNSANY